MKLASSLFSCFSPNDQIEEQDDDNDLPIQTPNPNPNFRVFTYNELKTATQGFKNKIGEGGFGAVYMGRLGYDIVAVKVLNIELDTMRGEREFIAEIAALSDIKHENLVSLKGCCVDGSRRLLVYEHMENNSLTRTLLGTEQNRVKFTWSLRKHISLGVAEGLRYLHEEVKPHIVHRDIKASNILLDQHFTPKLGDFGLSKMFRDNVSHISTRVAGTLGYISPEYAHTGQLTRKSDVYSFGVLLLEIVSGRPVVDYHLQYGEQFLVEKAYDFYKVKNLLELVDEVLKDFSQEEAPRFLRVGLLCVQETTKLRPAMSTVVKMLKNEMETENVEISRPGLVADLMSVKIRDKSSANWTSSPASNSTNSFGVR